VPSTSGHDDRSAYGTVEGLASLLAAAVREAGFPQYGYGVVQAVALATQLGVPAISVLELGVAGGNGLVELQALCERHAVSGIDLSPVGFDLGEGMPAPCDHRDMPYVWRGGFFRMDRERLEARLDRAELVIGDVAQTGRAFLARRPPPIGFVSFDLDYWSSTRAAFDALLLGDPERYLPRIVCYFDDTVGPHAEMHSRFTGELLAIDEFNREHERRKLAKPNGLRYKLLPYEGAWVEGIHVLHLFDHPRYDDYVYPERDRQFPLEVRRDTRYGPAPG
jgi:hypothetical protein